MRSICNILTDHSDQWNLYHGRQNCHPRSAPGQVKSLYRVSILNLLNHDFFCSTNVWPFLPAPGMCLNRSAIPQCIHVTLAAGADDDGSGSVTILESYRALISSNFRPVRPVEFHWYSAEVRKFTAVLHIELIADPMAPAMQEGGLLGSQAVASAYEARSANVYAMSQVCGRSPRLWG